MLEDPLFWLLVLPGLLLGAYAQWRIKANVAKYSHRRGGGAQVARLAGPSRCEDRGHSWDADRSL